MPSSKDILRLVIDHSGLKRQITSSNDFVTELGIDGDDAEELIEAISAKYPFSTNEINWKKYFHSEAELLSQLYIPKLIAYKIGISKSPPLRFVEPLSVETLMQFYNAPPCNA